MLIKIALAIIFTGFQDAVSNKIYIKVVMAAESASTASALPMLHLFIQSSQLTTHIIKPVAITILFTGTIPWVLSAGYTDHAMTMTPAHKMLVLTLNA
jgi:hypothetical protein